MTPIEIMRNGLWVRADGLNAVKRGDTFRIIGRNNERGNPHTAEHDAAQRPHPRRKDILVWSVDDSIFEPVPRAKK
jgi:hypothetical protein